MHLAVVCVLGELVDQQARVRGHRRRDLLKELERLQVRQVVEDVRQGVVQRAPYGLRAAILEVPHHHRDLGHATDLRVELLQDEVARLEVRIRLLDLEEHLATAAADVDHDDRALRPGDGGVEVVPEALNALRHLPEPAELALHEHVEAVHAALELHDGVRVLPRESFIPHQLVGVLHGRVGLLEGILEAGVDQLPHQKRAGEERLGGTASEESVAD